MPWTGFRVSNLGFRFWVHHSSASDPTTSFSVVVLSVEPDLLHGDPFFKKAHPSFNGPKRVYVKGQGLKCLAFKTLEGQDCARPAVIPVSDVKDYKASFGPCLFCLLFFLVPAGIPVLLLEFSMPLALRSVAFVEVQSET